MSYDIDIRDTGERYRCEATQTLLAGMEKLGRKGIPVGCRGGGCGVCKVRVEQGSVQTGRMSRAHVSAKEETQGYVLACRAYPLSDLHVRPAAVLSRCLQRHRP